MRQKNPTINQSALWPELPYEKWKDTCITLHMWSQIVGKVKLALAPFLNEWWEVAFLVTARGLTTSAIPFKDRSFQVNFDFIDHELSIVLDDGNSRTIPLVPQSVADFYNKFMNHLISLGIRVRINTKPVEVENTIPFERDSAHASYDPEFANCFWRILVQADKVFQKYRSPFFGKSSPVHFFWGSFDLAETRFSGRLAPKPQTADRIMRVAMDEEQIAVGFWPGNDQIKTPAFYAYAYPEPPGYKTAELKPGNAYYDKTLGEFLLNYENVRTSAFPERLILDFLQSNYEAGATLGKWDRKVLERQIL
jgi:hypothetical protein